MNINWLLRLKNKATLTTLIVLAISFNYQVLGLFGIVPSVSQDMLIQLAGIIVNILAAFGVVVDPTTAGVSDSARAQGYDNPYTDATKEEA